MPHNEHLNSPTWLGLDPQRREAFQRALDVAGVGAVLLQTAIDKVVQSIVIRELGFQAWLPRKAGAGDAWYVNRRTVPGVGADWVADTAVPAEVTGTYAQVAFPYRSLVSRGRVTRFLQARGRLYGDILASEITMKAEDYADEIERTLIIGDTVADPDQPNGFLTLVNAVAGQVVANTTAVAGDAVSLDRLDAAIDAVKGAGGREDVAVIGSFAGIRQVNAALQAQQQFTNMVEVAAGFRVRTYDGAPIITSTRMPDVLVWTGTNVTAFAGGATTALLVVNRRYNWLGELTPTTVMPLARTSSQFDEFDLFSDVAPVFANTRGASILGGINPTA